MEKFAERLKIAMDLRGVNQTMVSLNCKIDKGNLSHYLKGDFEPKQEIVIRIADYLNVSVLWLLGLTDTMSGEVRALNSVSIKKAVGLPLNEEDLKRQTLLDDISAICSRQDLETLKTMYGVIKTLAKK